MSSYTYSTLSNTGVNNNGTGGAQLTQGSSSYSDYIQSCENSCNADSTCAGFVDNAGQCNPKTLTGINTAQDYKSGKTLYIKGSATDTTDSTDSTDYTGWVYPPTENTYYTLVENNLVGNWSITNITNSTTMSISFWINILNTSSNWRNIFHVTNQNVDCCNPGNRVPGMWIWPNNTEFHVPVSTTTNGNTYPPSTTYGLALNTPVFLTIVFNSTTMTLYANAISIQTYSYTSPLVVANTDASFYIGDPWYTCDGIEIKNFTLYNSVFSSSDVTNLYEQSCDVPPPPLPILSSSNFSTEYFQDYYDKNNKRNNFLIIIFIIFFIIIIYGIIILTKK